jgi:hypothetical protein
MIRAIALDIDGTLLDSRQRISDANRAAIEDARGAGIEVALVTGRRYPAARRIALDLGGAPLLVLHNGGLIMGSADGSRPLRVRPLPRRSARAVVAAARSFGADPVLHVGHGGEGHLYVETASPAHTLLAYYLSKSHPDVRVVPSLERFLDDATDDPIQVMFGGSLREMARLEQSLEPSLAGAKALRTTYSASDLSLIDVVEASVDKAEALAFLCGLWNLELSNVLAIGDNWNDRGMLLAAGRGCVMGNADPELRALGLPVVARNDDDGVAEAIRGFALAGR